MDESSCQGIFKHIGEKLDFLWRGRGLTPKTLHDYDTSSIVKELDPLRLKFEEKNY